MGQDGGQSIDLGGGDVLFVFADTLLAYRTSAIESWPEMRWPIRRDQGRFLANCAARGRGRELAASLATITYYADREGWPREIIEATPAEHLAHVRFWPEHGVAVNGEVFLYYLGIQHVAQKSTWGFRVLGTGLAVLDPESGALRRLRWNGDWKLWPLSGDDLHCGVQVLREGDTVFVFASLREGARTSARMGRVDASSLGDPSAYEYLTSSAPAWSRDPSRSLDLGVCDSEFSVSFNAYLDAYIMCGLDETRRRLQLRFARHPWGPYTAPVTAGGVPLEPRNDVAALAFEHPLFSSGGGRTIAVSYCQPNFTQNGLLNVTFV